MNNLNMKTIPLKVIFSILLLGCPFLNAAAQKLPNVQMASVRAPANIKIDGKATEWNNKFQAYNHATDVFYTVSNDDSKLYLIVQAPDRPIINKILRGGVTFTVQKSDKKTDNGGISITYPIFDKRNTPFVPPTFSNRPSGPGDEIATPAGSYNRVNDSKDFKSDSMMMIYNKSLTTYSKFIGVTGVKNLDSLIAVYNNDGIRVAQLFDNKICYTYELAIDLKLLGLKASDVSKFAYHITINGLSIFTVPDRQSKPGGDDVRTDMSGSAATDVWGEYTLAKH
jgi:hypothetical protein